MSESAAKRAETEAMAGEMIRTCCEAVNEVLGGDFTFMIVVQPFDHPSKGLLWGGNADNVHLYEIAAALVSNMKERTIG